MEISIKRSLSFFEWKSTAGGGTDLELEALNGHKRLSTDQKHVSYLGKPPLKRINEETQPKTLQHRLRQQIEENKTLKSLVTQKNKDGSVNNEKVIRQGTEQGNKKLSI